MTSMSGTSVALDFIGGRVIHLDRFQPHYRIIARECRLPKDVSMTLVDMASAACLLWVWHLDRRCIGSAVE